MGAPPRGLRLKSKGRKHGQGIRIQRRQALSEAGSWELHVQGFVVEHSQTPGWLGCRSRRPSSREGAAPGSRLGRVSSLWSCGTPGRGEDTGESTDRGGIGRSLWGTLPRPRSGPAPAPPRPQAPPQPCCAAHSPRPGREPRGPPPPPPRAPAMRAAPAAPLLQLLLLLGPRLQAAGVAEPPLPTVVLVILARNAEHSLPHYLGALERLDYPRARLALW